MAAALEEVGLKAVIDVAEAVPIKLLPPEEYAIEKAKSKLDANDLASTLQLDAFLSEVARHIEEAPVVHRGNGRLISLRDLRVMYPRLRDPIIDGILRKGEIMNIIAAPKEGKSWLSLDLALTIIQGAKWFGRFQTRCGRVLIVDNELHKETIAFRSGLASETRSRVIDIDYVDEMIDYIPLRGQLVTLEEMANEIKDVNPGDYKLIILDAFYRFLGKGIDESDNGDMTSMYSMLDAYAEKTDCAICVIHHTSKGVQSGKKVTDVGSGAGVQSRASDTHLILLPHKEPGVLVLDAAIRSFPKLGKVCLRRKFPSWEVDANLDPDDLESAVAERSPSAVSKEQRQADVTKLLDALTEPKTIAQMVGMATSMGIKLHYGQINKLVKEDWLPNSKVTTDETVKGPKVYIKKGVQAQSVSAPVSEQNTPVSEHVVEQPASENAETDDVPF